MNVWGECAADVDTGPVQPAVGGAETLDHGSIVIAAITSCTNTSNPSVMLVADCWPSARSNAD
jgi:aconitate hydratase